MKRKIKKLLSVWLVVCTLLSLFSVNLTATAVDTATQKATSNATPAVEIVSFMRGAQEDLRSSELLEARLTGYDGNAQELTYKWENNLSTYLYVYNSHNMDYANNTDNEVEIYNKRISSSPDMQGRSYKDSFTGKGYRWASVYGSNTSGTGSSAMGFNAAYIGAITVTVYDANGSIVATDSHSGTIEFVDTVKNTGFIDYDLQEDLANATIGLFEGETQKVKDLLGEASIVHINCDESAVTAGEIVSGSDHIKLTQNGDYYISGLKAGTSSDSNGDAKINITVEKNACGFHEYTEATATTAVYVFKKPTIVTTSYTLTLKDNLDSRCRYFIEGREGVKQEDGTILFDGLTPDTQYMVEVRAEYKDNENKTRYTYAYEYGTTKPIYKANANVEVYLDATYDSATHTATGTKVNLEDVSGYSTIYAKSVDGTEFIELNKKEGTTGTYTNILNTGSYNLYYTANESTKIDDQLLVIENTDYTRYLFYNSVTYNDGDKELEKEYYVADSSVIVSNNVPKKEGYIFKGWKDQNGTIYNKGALLTQKISTPYVLTAQWGESADVYVNITIEHKEEGENGSIANDSDMHNVSYDLMTKLSGTDNYVDLATRNIVWDGKSDFTVNGYSVTYKDDTTVYKAISPIAKNVLAGSNYTVEIAKSEYELYEVSTSVDEAGNIIVNAKLRYAPSNFDFVFSVELDRESKKLPYEMLPVAVHVKVNCWYDDPFDDEEVFDWTTITQHRDAFITVPLDEGGKGEGFYPVWCQTADGERYAYRIEIVSYVLPDGTILPAKDGTEFENSHIEEKHTAYCTASQRYHAEIEASNGYKPDGGTPLIGACITESGQQGIIKAVITVNTHRVTIQPSGGTFPDGTICPKTVEKQVVVPDLDDYEVKKDGGYIFEGWYLVEDGKITDQEITSYNELYDDITIRAKWRAPLTVQGVVSIAGYYHLDDNQDEIRVINKAARAYEVEVCLQKILPNGYTETVSTQKIDISYNDQEMTGIDKPIGTGNYCFTSIPDDGYSYRIFIQNPNYDVKYQNEPDSIDTNKVSNYEEYYFHETEKDSYNANFGDVDPLVADVNAFMEFTPSEFELHYEVYATKIGEGYRPSTTDVLVLCDDKQSGNNPQDWPVITQMVKDNTEIGQETEINASTATGKNSHEVWRTMPDGQTFYDYGVLLQNYTINGDEATYNSDDAPFYVNYNGSASYTPVEGLTPEHQTQLLTIELLPKTYTVTFDPGFNETEEDYMENMDDYAEEIDGKIVHNTDHVWSYDTDISDVIPTREGYDFLGWYDENGNKVTEIDASVHEDVTVTAKWSFKVIFHANNKDIDYDVFRTYYPNGVEVTGENNFNLHPDGSLDSFYAIPEFEYYTHNNYVFKGWYLDEDNDNDTRPINWKELYTGPADVYAHWILVEDVEKDENDTKLYDNSGMYPGYDLLGVQIRDILDENNDHYGEQGTGLRFVTVLSEDVYSQINILSPKNANGAEYGYALAKTATAQKYATGKDGYKLEYKGANVNGKNTTTEYKYIQNLKCSGVPDHFNGKDYRLYTAVVTFKNLEDDALEQAQSQAIVARSYIRYTDANGLFRTHYNNYTGTNTYHGCSASFELAKSLMNG